MDEVFFREAVAMGLDRKDPAVKRRMRQIIEMMLDDYATVYPTESQLQFYLSENAEDFRLPLRITFQHQYFKPEDKDDAIKQLAKLKAGESSDKELNNNLLMIPSSFENETAFEIEKLFGKSFTTDAFALESTGWEGPLESAYGWHLVKIDRITQGDVPPLSEVRIQVEREWMVEQSKKMKQKQYEIMRSKYDISVDDLIIRGIY